MPLLQETTTIVLQALRLSEIINAFRTVSVHLLVQRRDQVKTYPIRVNFSHVRTSR